MQNSAGIRAGFSQSQRNVSNAEPYAERGRLMLRWPPSFRAHRESSRMASPAAASIEQVAALIRGRRSVDLYEPDPVPNAVILEAIDVARWAPNHRLTQPWRFYLIGPATRRRGIDLAVGLDGGQKSGRASPLRPARPDA